MTATLERTASWPPRWCTAPEVEGSRGWQAAEFIESTCRIVKESVGGSVGELLRLRPWQRALLDGLLAEDAEGHLRHRTALIGMARKNGKSALGAGLALWGLFLGPDGGEIYSCAGTREQARIVFGSARRMVELDPELSAEAKIYRDAIELPSTGSVYRPLSREAGMSEGLSPTLVIFDEVHVQADRELWDVMQLGAAARPEPLMVGITTAGARTDQHGRDSLCFQLYLHGRRVVSGEIDDPAFFFAWWEPEAGVEADHTDPAVWAESNPGLGDLCAVEDFHATLPRTPEAEFRTKRTNVWTVHSSSALPHGVWGKLASDRIIDPETRVVLVGDGSWSGDSTALLAVTVEERPHLWPVGLWEKPEGVRDWRVPVAEVEQAIRHASKALPVVEVAMDPYRWQRSMQILEDEGLPIVEYPMGSVERMVKAWKVFYDAALDEGLTHSGDPALERHVGNMVLKLDARGARPTKDSKMSERHIDLGVCAVAGVDRAVWWLGQQPDGDADFYLI